MAVNPRPDGYHTVTPYLIVADVGRLLTFLEAAFGAEVIERVEGPGGGVRHAEVRLGDSVIMMGPSRDDWPPMPTMLYLYLPACDEVYAQALQAGGTSLREPQDEFYGDRTAGVRGPEGNAWWVATRVENVPPDEMGRRAAAAGG